MAVERDAGCRVRSAAPSLIEDGEHERDHGTGFSTP
jgi:hypothetical protein